MLLLAEEFKFLHPLNYSRLADGAVSMNSSDLPVWVGAYICILDGDSHFCTRTRVCGSCMCLGAFLFCAPLPVVVVNLAGFLFYDSFLLVRSAADGY